MLASLYRVELATNTAAVIATWSGQLSGSATCDDDGTVYLSASDLATTTHYTHAVRPNGWGPAAVTTTTDALSVSPAGIALDRVSGRYLVAAAGFAPTFPSANRNTLSLVDPSTGASTVIAGSPGGWGTMGLGPAVHDAIESYGASSDGQNHYWFANFPNPGGLPTIGNAGFSLTMGSAPGPASLSVLALSSGRGSVNVAGIEVLVDLGSSIVTYAPGSAVALPIPGDPSLAGVVITAQSVHVEPGNTLAASRGLSLTIQ